MNSEYEIENKIEETKMNIGVIPQLQQQKSDLQSDLTKFHELIKQLEVEIIFIIFNIVRIIIIHYKIK